MGNDQSRSAKGGEEANDGPIDYYELLKVDVEATPDEIKVRPLAGVTILSPCSSADKRCRSRTVNWLWVTFN